MKDCNREIQLNTCEYPKEASTDFLVGNWKFYLMHIAIMKQWQCRELFYAFFEQEDNFLFYKIKLFHGATHWEAKFQ